MNYEIEKKFLIAKPDEEFLKKLPSCEFSSMEQIYLKSADGVSERIRMRKYDGSVVYYHTLKKRISDMRRVEEEKTVTADEYNELKKRADKDLSAIYKCRYCIPYDGHTLEIDVFPFWKNRAYLEVELSDENEAFSLPPYIKIIRDVTADGRYTNHSLAYRVPDEDLL